MVIDSQQNKQIRSISASGKYILLLLLLWILFLKPTFPQAPTDSGTIKIPYFSGDIVIDGVTGDWDTKEIILFSDTSAFLHSPKEYSFQATYEGLDIQEILPPKSRNSVRALLCWNLTGLYFAFEVQDRHLMAEINKGHDHPEIYLNDGIEIYIDSKFDSKTKMDINDYQFMIDILSNTTIFKGARRLQDSIKYSVPKDYGLNIMIEVKATTSGSISLPLSPDTGYIVEVRIPFEAIGIVPETGKKFRIDLCNNDNDYFLNEYDLSDTLSVITRPFNWSGLNNFGYPEYWKVCQLTGKPGWFDKMSSEQKRTWIFTFMLISLLFLAVLLFSAYRIRKLKRIPNLTEVTPAKLVFIRQPQDPLPDQTLNQRYLQKASELISEKYSDNMNSEDVAVHIGVSLRKFQRITKEELNCTPTNFIYLVKLNKAADFIKSNRANISEVAYQFGFSSPSYFTKIFKSHFGVTPVEYKNSDTFSNNSDRIPPAT